MQRILLFVVTLLCAGSGYAWERETVWPKGKMPHRPNHQIAAMTDEAGDPKFDADRHRVAYLEWFEQLEESVHNGACMILISGGAYESCCDVGLIKLWHETLTKQGIQCELHTLALNDHCFYQYASPGTGRYTWLDQIQEYLKKLKVL